MKAVLQSAGASTVHAMSLLSRRFGAWISTIALPYLITNWKMTWATISVAGLIFSVMFGYSWETISGWLLSTVLAVITFNNWWEDIHRGTGKAFSYAGAKIGYILAGNKGWDTALLLWIIISSGIAWGLFSLQGPNDISVFLFGSAVLAAPVAGVIFINRMSG